MNLTLDLEEETPEISLTFIKCSTNIYQLVYSINSSLKLNFSKSKKPFTITRNGNKLSFNYWENSTSENILWLIDQRCFLENSGNNLFEAFGAIESMHLLIKPYKLYPVLLIHQHNNTTLNNLIKNITLQPNIQEKQIVCLNDLNKIDLKNILDIYHDKQN